MYLQRANLVHEIAKSNWFWRMQLVGILCQQIIAWMGREELIIFSKVGVGFLIFMVRAKNALRKQILHVSTV